jgi:hypothetical protein
MRSDHLKKHLKTHQGAMKVQAPDAKRANTSSHSAGISASEEVASEDEYIDVQF